MWVFAALPRCPCLPQLFPACTALSCHRSNPSHPSLYSAVQQTSIMLNKPEQGMSVAFVDSTNSRDPAFIEFTWVIVRFHNHVSRSDCPQLTVGRKTHSTRCAKRCEQKHNERSDTAPSSRRMLRDEGSRVWGVPTVHQRYV